MRKNRGKLSDRQRCMLDYISQFQGESGYPPTIRQIGAACDISSTSVVNYNLKKLEKENFIVRDLKVSRGIRVINPPTAQPAASNLVNVPIVGRIFASEPVEYPDPSSSFAPDEVLALTRDLVSDRDELFALEVRGDSMIDAMVSDGDIVVMKRVVEANNGDMVAVWLRDEGATTLKRFYLEDGRVRLQPANPTMEPIYVDPANVEIQGKVVLVVRQL